MMRGAKFVMAGLIGAAAMLGGLSGCVGWNVYPAMEGEHGFSNPNSDPMPTIMTEALKWVVVRYPPNERAEWTGGAPVVNEEAADGPFAVNLPKGLNRAVYTKIAENVGHGAVAMAPGNEGLPTYHISRLWVRGDEARVDLVRPVLGIPPGPDGRPATQGMTLRLRGGLEPWHVTSHNVWSLSTVPAPSLSYVPED